MRHRNIEDQKRLKKTAEAIRGNYAPWGVYYEDGRYKQYWYSKKEHKKKYNKKVRRFQGELSDGSEFKKIAEYWWEVY